MYLRIHVFETRVSECRQIYQIKLKQVFLRCFRDPIRVPRIENRVPRISEKYLQSVESEKMGSLESEKSGPYRSIPGT